ncbi:ceroid-lipofuscinosis neuronal protein 6 homolog [Platichthys flesus]|uniref:ceroid-lipofuscinosis neuronal protein 6 homolog n=1 Tax=Platichthys flesus TaxID=8260 RepID=UPI002DB8CD81|nr:ceroid-lipofuscinosis neuronal protein 6 homolog [Platichthys flesus]
MQPSVRKRPSSGRPAAMFTCSRSGSSAEPVLPRPRFHLDLWLSFTVQNWVLDMGRPVVTLVLPANLIPLNRPGAAELLHLLYNVTAPLILLKNTSHRTRHTEHVTQNTSHRTRHTEHITTTASCPSQMLERCPRSLSVPVVHLGLISTVMGSSLHLVADSITRRLVLIGYELHLSVRENPVMKELRPSSLIDVFELLFGYDDTLGHLMWYVPLFLVLLFFFSGCFCHRTQADRMSPAAWTLLAPNTTYYWFLMTEGQTFILFIFTFFAMTATVMHQRGRGLVPDSNGLFLLNSFSAALVLVLIWVLCLWDDGVLRRRHPGLIYVPQPSAVYSLHLHLVNSTQT